MDCIKRVTIIPFAYFACVFTTMANGNTIGVFNFKKGQSTKNDGTIFIGDDEVKNFNNKYYLNSNNKTYPFPLSLRFGINGNFMRYYSCKTSDRPNNIQGCALHHDFGGGLNLCVDWLICTKSAANKAGFFPRIGIAAQYYDFDHVVGRFTLDKSAKALTIIGYSTFILLKDIFFAIGDLGIGICNGLGYAICGCIDAFKTNKIGFGGFSMLNHNFFDYDWKQTLQNCFDKNANSYKYRYSLFKEQQYLDHFNGIVDILTYFEPEVDNTTIFRLVPQVGIGLSFFAVTKNCNKYTDVSKSNDKRLYTPILDPIFSFKLVGKFKIIKSWYIVVEAGYTYNPLLFLNNNNNQRMIIGGIKNLVFGISGNYTFFEGLETVDWFNEYKSRDISLGYASYVSLYGFACEEFEAAISSGVMGKAISGAYTGGGALDIHLPLLWRISKIHSLGMFTTLEIQGSKFKKFVNTAYQDKEFFDLLSLVVGVSHSFNYKTLRIDNRIGLYLFSDGEFFGRKKICEYKDGSTDKPVVKNDWQDPLVGRLRHSIVFNIKLLDLLGIKSVIREYFYISMGANTNIIGYTNDLANDRLGNHTYEFFKIENIFLGVSIRII